MCIRDSYRHSFELGNDWKDRRTFIAFNGVDSAFYLYVNGEEVGYSQDSRTTAEFNITDYLKDGENQLAVKVFRYSDGSYLEDQDFWRLSGIFRDVYLRSVADVFVRDIHANASLLKSNNQGSLIYTLDVENQSDQNPPAGVKIEVTLVDLDGEVVASVPNTLHITEGKSNRAEISLPVVQDVKAWSSEHPHLYTCVAKLSRMSAAAKEKVLSVHALSLIHI